MLEMTGLRVAIDATPGSAGALQYNTALKSMGVTAGTVTAGIKAQLASMAVATKTMATTVSQQLAIMKANFIGMKEIMAAGILGFGLEKLTEHVVKVDKIRMALTRLTGSAAGAAVEWKRLQDQADKFGMPAEKIGQQYAKMAIAMKGTALGGSRTPDIFEGILSGIRSFGGGADELDSVMEKVMAILSKGKVQGSMMMRALARELPGVGQDMAKAMGMTLNQLTEAMDKQQIGSEELIYKWAMLMKKEYRQAALDAATGMEGVKNRLTNSLDELADAFANSGLEKSLVGAFRQLGETIKTPEFHAFAAWLGSVLTGVINVLSGAVKLFGANLGIAKTALIGIVAVEVGGRLLRIGAAFAQIALATGVWVKNLIAARAAQEALTAAQTVGGVAGAGSIVAQASGGLGGLAAKELLQRQAAVGLGGASASTLGGAAAAGGMGVAVIASLVAAVLAALGIGWLLTKAREGAGSKADIVGLPTGAPALAVATITAIATRSMAPFRHLGEAPHMAVAHAQETAPPAVAGAEKFPPFRTGKGPKDPITLLLEDAALKASYAKQMAAAALQGPAAVSTLQGAQQTALEIAKGQPLGLTGKWSPKMGMDKLVEMIQKGMETNTLQTTLGGKQGKYAGLMEDTRQSDIAMKANTFLAQNTLETKENTETQQGLTAEILKGGQAAEIYTRHRTASLALEKQFAGMTVQQLRDAEAAGAAVAKQTGQTTAETQERAKLIAQLLKQADAVNDLTAANERVKAFKTEGTRVDDDIRLAKARADAILESAAAYDIASAAAEAYNFAVQHGGENDKAAIADLTQKLNLAKQWHDIEQTRQQLVTSYDPLRNEREQIQKIKEATQGHPELQSAANQAIRDIQQNTIGALDAIDMKTKTWAGGMTAAFRDIFQESQDMAKVAYDATMQLYKGMTDNLNKALWGEGTDWTKMFRGVGQTITSGIIAKEVTGPLMGALGSTLGIDITKADGSQQSPFYVKLVDSMGSVLGGAGSSGGGFFLGGSNSGSGGTGLLGGLLGKLGGWLSPSASLANPYGAVTGQTPGVGYVVSGYGSGIGAEGGTGYASGTDYVPRTGKYTLHEGEAVLTKDENRSRATINQTWVIQTPDPSAFGASRHQITSDSAAMAMRAMARTG